MVDGAGGGPTCQSQWPVFPSPHVTPVAPPSERVSPQRHKVKSNFAKRNPSNGKKEVSRTDCMLLGARTMQGITSAVALSHVRSVLGCKPLAPKSQNHHIVWKAHNKDMTPFTPK